MISRALHFGDDEIYPVALVALNEAEAGSFARANQTEQENCADSTRDEKIFQLMKDNRRTTKDGCFVVRANQKIYNFGKRFSDGKIIKIKRLR